MDNAQGMLAGMGTGATLGFLVLCYLNSLFWQNSKKRAGFFMVYLALFAGVVLAWGISALYGAINWENDSLRTYAADNFLILSPVGVLINLAWTLYSPRFLRRRHHRHTQDQGSQTEGMRW